jgi:hypothetical protein
MEAVVNDLDAFVASKLGWAEVRDADATPPPAER